MNNKYLPFYRYMEEEFNKKYPHVPFNNSDYWLNISLALVLITISGVIISFIISEIYDFIDKKKKTGSYHFGHVVDKSFTPEHTSSVLLPVTTSNGKGGINITFQQRTTYYPDKYQIAVRDNTTGDIERISITPEKYYSLQIHHPVEYYIIRGGWSKSVLKTALVS